MRVARMVVALACAGVLLSGCNQGDQQKQAPTEEKQQEKQKEQPAQEEKQATGLESVKYTDEQKKSITEAAVTANLNTAYIPTQLPKGWTFTNVVPAQSFFSLQYDNLVVTESSKELPANGVKVDEKDVTLENGTKAKWIATSTTADNKDGAAARLYFQLKDTFISLGTGKKEFDPKVEAIANSFEAMK